MLEWLGEWKLGFIPTFQPTLSVPLRPIGTAVVNQTLKELCPTMGITSKYFDEAQLQRLVTETEQEIDRRSIQQEADARLQQMINYINDPANKATIDNDPAVQRLRAMGQPEQPAKPSQPQRPPVYVPKIIDPMVR
jgi:uncharacterized protein YciW